MLYILMILNPSYRDPALKIGNFPIGLRVQHLGVYKEQFPKYIFNITEILNLSYSCLTNLFHVIVIINLPVSS